MNKTSFPHKHLLGIADLSTDDIHTLLSRANHYADALDKGGFSPDILKDKIILTLFFEDSTRTRTSFDIAAKRLGAQVVNLDLKSSSLNKGESFRDTILTLNAMRPDGIIIRHHEYGAPKAVADMVDCPVINAGDSWREHPTQALLDALTIQRKIGDISGKTIAMIGDIAHSRVANSNMRIFSKLGANIHVIAPELLMPEKFPVNDVQKFTSLKDGLNGVDIIISDGGNGFIGG
jgi:aspartate carbamoyltransferase catalytic subunit